MSTLFGQTKAEQSKSSPNEHLIRTGQGGTIQIKSE
jgi:hypothetical protein